MTQRDQPTVRPTRPGAPSVFISSTSDDLGPYRAEARNAAVAAGLLPAMMEHFTASGERPPLEACLAKVADCDVLVVIVAHRYGWKPARRGKSITWLECEEAIRRGMEVIAFVVDETCEWPSGSRESHRITEAVESGTATPQLLKEVQDDIGKLAGFKKWLNGRGIRGTFSSPVDLRGKVEGALREWLNRSQRQAIVQSPAPEEGDPAIYLDQLREQCAWIDIRGLQVGTGKAYRFPIEELYIPLTMPRLAGAPGGRRPDATPEGLAGKSVLLEEALAHPRLVLVGDPGCGKSTFLRHIALAKVNEFAVSPATAAFPILIRISELVDHIGRRNGPWPDDSPKWLADFLAAKSDEANQGLGEPFFRARLQGGRCLLLVDGLDEAPQAGQREAAVRLLENATRAYRQCRFVVTIRPLAYQGRTVLAGFETAHIEPLDTPAMEAFLGRWCAALFPEGGAPAKRHLGELTGALRSVPEIRRMARNPVMLTALAVVHWNERRLPEQRADLYESIVNWLARSRERRAGRPSAERCLTLLQQLALEMQRHPEGRQVQGEKGWAADVLASRFPGATEAERRELALRFVEEEEMDSGIVVSRGAAVRFWHLTFQEYLAARAIGGLVEADQRGLLLDQDRIYLPEWREVVLLLAGVLGVRQGAAKVDGLVSAVLDRLGPNAPLAAQAKCAGLLGSIVNDLRPLEYRPADERYQQLMDAVLGVFDREKAKTVEFAVRLAAAEALGQAGDPRIGRDNWVRIEGGPFRMGESGQEVVLTSFEIGRYPVTVAEYQRFVEDGGYLDERWWAAGGLGQYAEPDGWDEQRVHPNRPVGSVSWHEASAYCVWAGARLPSEAEWERVARGTEGRVYPWGDDEPDATRANYGEAGPGDVTPVGLYPLGATPEGVLDLAGNVWEWVEDPEESGTRRVLRGGSWNNDATYLRAGARFRLVPDYRYYNIGYRVAREVVIP